MSLHNQDINVNSNSNDNSSNDNSSVTSRVEDIAIIVATTTAALITVV